MMFQLLGDWPVQGGAVVVPADAVIDGTPAVASGGADYAANDSVTLTNGVVLIVAAIFKGAVSEWRVSDPGQMIGRPAAAGPVAQIKTSGAGTGATAIFPNWNGVPLPMPMPLNAKCLDQEAFDAMVRWYEPQSDQLLRLFHYSPNVNPKGAVNG
ncbi:hypothetical protein [Bradyrhizobium liaoningense]|uniref:hypothetical protein n=1 Tax=Bradyrhizobium liaoningense TaxID=43992 RepID=UPI001BABB0AC|nr:hypothetical protein [Bradyrhizobium liaoningense]MBR0705393.1 hypothetical protein [Bradyrhizobium liaoningense]